MNLPEDLLEQAEHLAGREATRPKQVSLRRAISAAYYALFHFLIREACGRLAGRPDLRVLAARAFNHGDMKKACQAVLKSPPPAHLAPLLGNPVRAALRTVADTFVVLQTTRHDADYNLSQRFTRDETRRRVESARDAFAATPLPAT